MDPIDVRHLGRERVICCWRVGDVLIDPGPESSLGPVLEAVGDEPPRALLLTHVHLDHAGGSGALVRRWPHLEVYVHEVGAPHLVDPAKLLASARRLYGDDMERLWGAVVPVPAENVRALSGGETVAGFRVDHTPGHASHHVSYLHEDSGRAFVGDVAGVQIVRGGLVLTPTPPPDVDVEAWYATLDEIEGRSPARLALVHFGVADDVRSHLAALRRRLADWLGIVEDGADEARFVADATRELQRAAGTDGLSVYEQAIQLRQSYAGLRRYADRRRTRN